MYQKATIKAIKGKKRVWKSGNRSGILMEFMGMAYRMIMSSIYIISGHLGCIFNVR